ncbi:hypothetical protein [Treponema phagedenis]|uniref:hypothetical protein n=1 Tax=Treponema phagedenis TaxID=162 RepID=UPI0004640887|nr:hypothetical protein [Treponema phagedenis]QEK05316.1 hypothetical protein FUT80_00265 [Treponema phagedenis]
MSKKETENKKLDAAQNNQETEGGNKLTENTSGENQNPSNENTSVQNEEALKTETQNNKDAAGGETQKENTDVKEENKKPQKSTGSKRRIKNEQLKKKKIIVFDGSTVSFDEKGIAELEEKYAEYLLTIPSYSEV